MSQFRDHFFRMIEGVDLVSFDVFDTALLRGVYKPTDIFLQIAIAASDLCILPDRFSGDPLIFSQLRQQAEMDARNELWKEHGWVEVKIEEIYSHVEKLLGIDQAASKELMALEYEIEMRHTITNNYILGLYDVAKRAGKKIGFVSDMYLDEDWVAKRLRDAGFEKPEFVRVSSSYRKTKAHGSLYQFIHEHQMLPYDRWLHIGDNYASDCVSAKKFGIHALHYEKVSARKDKSLSLAGHCTSELGQSNRQGTTILFKSVVEGLSTNKYYMDADNSRCYRDSLETDFWSVMGYQIVGPMLAGFGTWLLNGIEQQKLRNVYFLSRDGYLIKNVIDRLRASGGSIAPDFDASYLYASRRAFNLAAIDELTEDNIDFLVSGTSRMSPNQFLARIDIDINCHLDAVRRVGFSSPDEVIIDGLGYGRLRALLRELSEHILKRAQDEFIILKQYFDEMGLLAGGRIGVVDLGWHGSLQYSLKRLLHRMGAETEIVGYYMGTFPAASRYTDQGLCMHGYLCEKGQPEKLHEVIKLSVEIFEWIFSAPHGSVCNFQIKDNVVRPVFADFDFERPRWECADVMQREALRFIEDYFKLWRDLPVPEVAARDAICNLQRMLYEPTRQEATMLGDIQHAEGFGRVAITRYIAKPKGSIFNPFTYLNLVRGYRDSFWRRGYSKRLIGFSK